MTLSRRSFLQTLPAWMPRLAFAQNQTAPRGDTLVVIFLRGAADALNMIVPHGESAYYKLRPTLGIPRPDDRNASTNSRAVDLNGFFGFHPAMRSLIDSWQAKHLAIIHACGAPDESRSHFKAMELIERGVDDERGPASGWIGRHLATLNTNNSSPLRAVGVGKMPQRSLSGSIPVSALRSIADFHLKGNAQELARMRAMLNTLYNGDDSFSELGGETLRIMDSLQKLDPLKYKSKYPESEFGLALKQVAMLIKAEVGLEVAAVDLGGWDTHFAQGASEGAMAKNLRDLADGLAAFHADMIDSLQHLTVVAMSEFGRRAEENGSLGTDHGHGGAMMVMGGNVVGGVIHGKWPGLAKDQLIAPGDLAVTTDYRDVLGEVCAKRLNNKMLAEIFPNYNVTMKGVIK
ncbi:MAG: DUF1501 domain-containing protein [Chloroflexi bacterium]|nr:DUF1501 domain-containing protein [Chloroflexota bacterium]